MGAKANAHLLKSDSAEHLIVAVRAAVLDPEGGDAVVGMPPSMLVPTGRGRLGEVWWAGGGPRWVFFDDEKTSETYSQRIWSCPGCGKAFKP